MKTFLFFLLFALGWASFLPAAAADSVVDTMDDGDVQLMVSNGWSGTWFVSDDGTGTVFPAPWTFTMTAGGLTCPGYAAMLSGTAHAGFGALQNFYLKSPIAPVDLTPYTAVSFYAKCGASSYPTIRVELPDVNTDPAGGICAPCFDDHGVYVTLTSTWTKYTVPFSWVAQAGWGWPQLPLDPGQILGVKFTVPGGMYIPGGVDFEIWVDEIAFTNTLAPLTQIPTPAPTCASPGMATATPSPTFAQSPTISQTFSPTPTFSVTPTVSATFSISSTLTHSPLVTPTFTPLPNNPNAKVEIIGVYPNPIGSDGTTFGIKSPVRGEILLRIFSLKGELITSITKAVPSAGSYELPWDARNGGGNAVSFGSYYLQVSVNGVGSNSKAGKWITVKR